MASYGGGGSGGPPGLANNGDGSIQAILARLQQSQQRPANNESNAPQVPVYDQQRQYAPQQLQQQPQQQQWQINNGPDMRVPQYSYSNPQQPQQSQQQQPLAHRNSSQQPASFSGQESTTYPPPAAPTPPSGGMYPPGMSAKDTSLLNLLKASSGRDDQQPASQPTMPSQPSSNQLRHESMIRHASDQGSRVIHAPAPSSQDPTGMLAALMLGKYQDDLPRPESKHEQEGAPGANWNSTAPPEATQQYLLNLLNKPKPSQHESAPANEQTEQRSAPPSVPTASSFDFASKESNPPHLKFDSPAPAQSSREASDASPAPHAAMFTHKNPFSDLQDAIKSPSNGSSPHLRGAGNVLSKHILQKSDEHKRLSSTSSHLEGRDSVRRKYDSTPTSQGQHSTPPYPVRESEEPEDMKDLVSKAGGESTEATARAEDEQTQARISHELEDMMAAETNEEFESAAAIVASDIKHELEKEENASALDVLGADASAVRDILDDAAQGPIVDSWESAEADDYTEEPIVVIEETSKPITVWNFPMKPWITITVGVGKDASKDKRPVFNEESILDIARLKKDFDQMDRNLVAASEYTLAYGMSKAGGLRVIRQDDGRDAKLFSDTKDRIFNVAVSSTPADENTTAKEALIGTGISGTVYWAQTKDGEKDHIEDAHIEQYGFALSPSSAQEGEAPGGVLKTRARPSSTHPEYFAVGRGKSINIVFPAFVMQRNLLKANHDRVVETDRLAKECSLKINTGKAGKDFSFSHDDTMVVSLDKSGRVKFWDVRELTATDDNRMPVHTSFEVKDPLMTLTTTPEGEKAWPTSVLLLDKLRPYQKRTALRYMIVGMKQNHTLQLWDLALSKPVQEFNLPHNKESDAVCSVMYHPPSGIIVVGHPTRNSIYFLHLSAPKYALKSSSQVDYIHKLVAQDPNLPNPDSTAVISGMREYSFANKGILRSLYLLQQPASASDGKEPTLFELYAMHSKGVACLSIKAPDLGWDKDNKVIDPVDAVEAGIVEIGKLKQPPPPAPAQPIQEWDKPLTVGPTAEPSRSVLKDLALPIRGPPVETSHQQPTTHKPREDVSLPKQKEIKEEEPAPATEKPEKKSRKKKAAADKAAAAAAALAEREAAGNHTNGTLPRVVNTTTRKSPEPNKPSASFTQEVDSRITSLEKRLVDSVLGELAALRGSLATDAEDRDRKFSLKQGALLATVSDCLNDNCQGVLAKIIEDELRISVLPMVVHELERVVNTTLDSKLSGALGQVLQKTLPKEIRKELQAGMPQAVDQAMRKPELVKSITDKMIGPLANKIDEQLEIILDDKILPRFTKTATDAALSCGREIMANVSTKFNTLEQVRAQDTQRFDQLMALNNSMSDTLNKMAIAQAGFQQEILRLKTEVSQQRQARQISPQQVATQQPYSVGPRGGNTSHHGPSNSQSHATSVIVSPERNSPLGFGTSSKHYKSLTGLGSPPSVQQWSNSSGALVSTPQQQYPAPAAPYQAANPAMSSLQQQSQQFSSPTSQVSSQVPSQPQYRERALLQPAPQDNQQSIEVDALCNEIRMNMAAGNIDAAVMVWIQKCKDEQQELVFEQVLSKYNPDFIPHLSNPLLLLGVGATVITNLDHSNVLPIKLQWAGIVLRLLDQNPPKPGDQAYEVAPKVLTKIKVALENTLIRLSQLRPHDAVLPTVSAMMALTRKIMGGDPVSAY